MNNHRHQAMVLERRRAKRAVRKEVRDICREITDDPDVINQDEFQLSHLGWEQQTTNK